MKVFLGGTVNNSKWRDYVMPRLKIDYFNPVVDEWNDEAQQREIHEREHCDFCLYVLTPRMLGYYSVAEVVDDSYKRTDRTIFTWLEKDDEFEFDRKQLGQIERIAETVRKNGATVLKNLDEVVEYLNSSLRRDTELLKNTDDSEKLMLEQAEREDGSVKSALKNVFISYGRKHSQHFAHRLYNKLTKDGYDAWFDMNNIPFAVDFQEQIDEGIRQADNFVYIMSPHSVKSEYCLKELVLALKYGKRIIPVLHIEPYDCWDRVHSEVGRRNWIYMRENEQQALDLVQAMQAKPAHQRQELVAAPLPDGTAIDNFTESYAGLKSVLEINKNYVRQHSIFLNMAHQWEKYNRQTSYLLVGHNRKMAEEFLNVSVFYNENNEETQAPCKPTETICEFITESKKNAHNLHTDVFIAYSLQNKEKQDVIYKSLNRHNITSWRHDRDIGKGMNYEEAINRGIEQADNFLYFISKEAIESPFCRAELDYALKLNKRIIPLLIESLEESQLPQQIRKLQFIDFSRAIDVKITKEQKAQTADVKRRIEEDVERRRGKPIYERRIDELLNTLNDDKDYYNLHKSLLVKALKWKKQNANQSLLLRGHNLENARNWLKLSEQKPHGATEHHHELIRESVAKIGQLHTEVFISYSRKDADFARKLNEQLQLYNKTTWFDQESIASASDFQAEIYKGIEQSDNFVFVISPQSIESPFCEDEVNYAASKSKRIISILWHETQADKMPDALQAIQWIDFEKTPYDKAFSELVRALDTDRDHVQGHTYWSQKATDWFNNDKTTDFLLRGLELQLANEWLTKANTENKLPEPTTLHREYIETSQQAAILAIKRERRALIRLRALLIMAIVAFIVALIFSVMAYNLKLQADVKTQEAKDNLILARENEAAAERSAKAAQLAKEETEEALVAIEQANAEMVKSQIITRKITSYLSFEGGFSPVRNDANRYGYINKQGDLSIPYQYQDARNFSEGMAAVKINEKYGYINLKGRLVIKPQFREAFNFSDGLARVIIGDSTAFINKEGEIAIQSNFVGVSDFDAGFAIISRNSMVGIINTEGQNVVPCQFDSINLSSLAQDFFICQQGNTTYKVDKQGNIVNAAEVVSTEDKAINFINLQNGNRLMLARNKFDITNTKYVFVDQQDRPVSLWFDRVYAFPSNAPAKVRLDSLYGFVNSRGTLVIRNIFTNATDFKNGIALVESKIPESNETDLYYIDIKGNRVKDFNADNLKNLRY